MSDTPRAGKDHPATTGFLKGYLPLAMTVRSLGYRTDLAILGGASEVADRGDHLVVRTPANPTFHWGNFLLFDAPPGPSDSERWRSTFAETFPEAEHVALGWDDPNGAAGEVDPFLDAGFRLDESVVLTARAVRRPPKWCEEAEVRPVGTDAEWDAVLDCHVAGRDSEYSEAGYREYSVRKIDRYRAMVADGNGLWFGAFLEGRLAGDLGLFVFEGVGRFQTVGTHPDFRRRGVCGRLVYEAAQCAFGRMGAETLVMVADAHYHAAAIYESVGFAPTERQVGLTWWEG